MQNHSLDVLKVYFQNKVQEDQKSVNRSNSVCSYYNCGKSSSTIKSTEYSNHLDSVVSTNIVDMVKILIDKRNQMASKLKEQKH